MKTFLNLVESYKINYFAIENLSEKSKQNYNSMYNSIQKYLIKANKEDLPCEVSPDFIDELVVYLRTKGTGLTLVSRTVEMCKRATDWGDMKGYCQNKINRCKVARTPLKEVVYLEENELEKLINAELNEGKKDIVKDLYIFQALTGLSFGDLWSYKIIKDGVGEWLYNQRTKNRHEYWVPLSPIVKAIHLKYNGKLPKVKNRNYNELIQEIAGDLKFDKHLTSHTARKTFATKMYDEGWSIESIADMMGHFSTETTRKHYIKRSRKRLETEVKQRQSA